MPPRPPDPLLRSLLEAALASPIGLLVRTNDFPRLRAKLYAIRAGEPGFAVLQFRAWHDPAEADMAITKAGAQSTAKVLQAPLPPPAI